MVIRGSLQSEQYRMIVGAQCQHCQIVVPSGVAASPAEGSSCGTFIIREALVFIRPLNSATSCATVAYVFFLYQQI